MAGERNLPGLGLYGFWTLGSNGYKTQNDSNLLTLSALVQARADAFISFLPGVPADGDIYVLDATADIHKIAVRDNGAWTLLVPAAGWLIWIDGESSHYVFDGAAWVPLRDLASTVPSFGSGDALKMIRVNAAENAYELFVPALLPAFTTGDALKVVRVNAAETGYELAAPGGGGGGATTFIALTDTPADYTGDALRVVRVNAAENALEFHTLTGASVGVAGLPFMQTIAVSDETTALTTGTAKVTFRMPRAVTLTAVRASVTTAPTGGTLLTVDINENGSTILSTKLTFDASERTTTSATTPAVISDSSLADDAEITIDIDAVGSTVAGAGLKVTLIGVYA